MLKLLKPSEKKINSAFDVSRYLLYVSRVEPRKNHVALARAFFELELDKQKIRSSIQTLFGKEYQDIAVDRYVA